MSLSTEDDSSLAPPLLFSSKGRLLLKGRGGLIVSIVSSVLIFGGLIAVFWLAPGGATVRAFYFNPHDLWQSFVGDPRAGLFSIGKAFVTNIWMCLISEVLVLAFALLIACVRLSLTPVLLPFRILATIYTDVFRGLPILLVVLMVGFGLPEMDLGFLSTQSPAVYGCAVLTLTYSAYVAEVFRAGVFSVPHGQLLAAKSLGLTHTSTLRRVILPQAVRTIIPPLLNDFISLQKDTALVSTLGVIEATRAAQIYSSTVFNFSGFVIAGALFLVITIPLTRFTDFLIARDRKRRLAGT